MISAIFVAIAILIVLGIILLNLEHHARKIKIAATIVLLMIVYFSITSVLNSGNVDMASPRGIVGGVYYYFGWLGNALGDVWSISKDSAIAIGNVIKINRTEETDGRN